MSAETPVVAVVDYGLGNLFSVKHACEYAGMQAIVTSSSNEIKAADAVILPGVGAFGEAMKSLEALGLVSVLKSIAVSSKPLVGICLGMQLLMTESFEFGRHKGLGIIEGSVACFNAPRDGERVLKIPQVGWNRIHPTRSWQDSLLGGLEDGTFMYFVHSYTVQPKDPQVVFSRSSYGDNEFCSSLGKGSLFACQFHPEKSGVKGLELYKNLKKAIKNG